MAKRYNKGDIGIYDYSPAHGGRQFLIVAKTIPARNGAGDVYNITKGIEERWLLEAITWLTGENASPDTPVPTP